MGSEPAPSPEVFAELIQNWTKTKILLITDQNNCLAENLPEEVSLSYVLYISKFYIFHLELIQTYQSLLIWRNWTDLSQSQIQIRSEPNLFFTLLLFFWFAFFVCMFCFVLFFFLLFQLLIFFKYNKSTFLTFRKHNVSFIFKWNILKLAVFHTNVILE